MRKESYSCEGYRRVQPGHSDSGEMTAGLSRRGLITGIGIGALAWLTSGSAIAQLAIDPKKKGQPNQVTVVVFLRGGADGLNLVVPYREDAYYRGRPNVSVPSLGKANGVLDLDGHFGLHPSLSTIFPLYKDGSMAMVQACGSNDDTRSHFEAMSAMESGLAKRGEGPSSGWIARHLATTEHEGDSPLRAVAIGGVMPDSLRGATRAVLMDSVHDYRLDLPEEEHEAAMRDLERLYSPGKDAVAQSGRETLDVLKTLNQIETTNTKAKYPESDIGRAFHEVSTLIRAEVGLEVACLDKGGWDTHVGQGSTVGVLPTLLDDLGRSIAAFVADMGPDMHRINVVVMSEFGRRLNENSGLGTDHGHGSVMFVIGGGVSGGKVHGKWPGLEPHQLTGPGDLQATTDYRNVLGELMTKRMGNAGVTSVFPGLAPAPVGVFA